MDKAELLALVESEEANCLAHYSSILSEQRRKAMDYYYAKPYGDEVVGRSQVVTSEVKDAVEGILPSLMAIFTSSDEIVRFDPQEPNDDAEASQATDYINYIFSRLNNGFLALYCLFKDALLQKNGYVKVWWENYEDQEQETYEGLTAPELALLSQDPELELVEHSVLEGPVDPMTGRPQELHNAKFKRTKKHGRICIEPVPPEEVLVSRECPNDLNKARFVEHRTLKSISEIREMGYDVPDEIADYAPQADFNQERVARLSFDDALSYRQDEDQADKTMRRVWLCEAYIRCDYDGDGIAELRKVTKVGKTVLENTEFDSIPIIGGPAILMPHKHYGLSIYDLVGDLQLIKSTVMRNLLDNAYVANNGRMEVLDGMVNMSDLLTSRPNQIVRVKTMGAIKRVDNPLLGNSFYNLLEYLDRVKVNRVGATDFPNAVDPDAINAKATFVDQYKQAALERINLMARILAEGPVKAIFWKILELVSKHQDKPRVVRLRGRVIPIDPRGWRNKFDVSVSVGLGTGNQHTALQGAMGILQVQNGLLQAGLAERVVTEANFYHAANEYAKLIFPKKAGAFFTDPTTLPPAQPKPDPKLIQLQQKAASDAAKLQQRNMKYGMDFLAKQQDRIDSKQELIAGHAHEAGMAARDHAHEHVQNERDRMTEHSASHMDRQAQQPASQSDGDGVDMKMAGQTQVMKVIANAIKELVTSQRELITSQQQINEKIVIALSQPKEAQAPAVVNVSPPNVKVQIAGGGKKVTKVMRDDKGNLLGAETSEAD